ncbi:uncharacterized protein J4E88_000228 [Alternaria novae-zelandiae]|uniref:uncharacterized protein n=1 Tax=Alternaria novae-zelandiae TaxID=430562 RepID=UPI0020C2EB79|nr:uncharacterized protein J4E88_000228 [Alternaria novae-zelandiae]KAI4696056.1 hypothetical protein J4E88_000228 [Alternaria novae-zelandiae]
MSVWPSMDQPRAPFGKYEVHFDDLEQKTHGKISAELSNLKNILIALPNKFNDAANAMTKASTHKARSKMQLEQLDDLGHFMPEMVHDTAFRQHLKNESDRDFHEFMDIRKQWDTMAYDTRDGIAERVLLLLEAIIENASTETKKVLQQKLKEARNQLSNLESASAARIQSLMRDKEDTRRMTAEVKAGFDKNWRALKEEYDELQKEHRVGIEKRVEERVRDEKIKLADRLSKAEAKASRYAKVLEEKEALEARILQESREKALLKQAKLEWEQKYKERDDEAKAVQQGYDQLSNDIQALQTENAVLQADHDELKKEHEPLPEEHKSKTEQRHIGLHAVAHPDVSPTTASDRQAAELQHLDGLVAIWQTTLANATAEMHESAGRKEALEAKIREAEKQLEKLKPALSQKAPRGSKPKSKPKGASKKEQAVVNKKADDKAVLQPVVNISGALPRVRVAAEAFPALSSPVLPQTIPSTTWKSLRLVDIPKEDTKGARKKSG